MDNPHVQDLELGYLAGIIDGEGCITLERSGNRRLSGVMGLQPKVIITNTDYVIIQYCMNIIKQLGVNPHVRSQDRSKKGWKTCYWLTVGGLSKCYKILSIMSKYLVAKNSQAILLLDFIKYRGNPTKAKGKPYGKYELNILDKIRALNHRGTTETEDYGLRHRIVGVK